MADRVVALCGKAKATREMPNLEPPEVELWGLSDTYMFLDRFKGGEHNPGDRWFEIHTPDEDGLYRGFTPWKPNGEQNHFNWLWDCGVPVYTNEVDSRLPTSVAFPYHEIGSKYRHYWTSAAAYMVSMAAYEGVDELHIWGMDMAGGHEYEHQRPCFEYWLGVLEAQGCKLLIPDCSSLLKPMVGSTYGLATSKVLDESTVRDEISLIDARLANGGKDPGARVALIEMLNRADPTNRGKPVEPAIIYDSEVEKLRKAVETDFAKR